MDTSPNVQIYVEGEDDNLEDLNSLDEFIGEESETREDNKYAQKVPPRIQKLRDLRKKSKVSFKQGVQFLAGVELDIQRKAENVLLIEDLYIHWCSYGNKTWLSPLEIISKYEEILLLYNGKRTNIAPFVENLTELAQKNVSPHAFLKYVQNPRMGADFNFRDWIPKHLNSLKIIAGILLELKESPPFDKDILGTDRIKIARDIVLVKYIGKPLSRFSEEALKKTGDLSTYKTSWSTLRLDNTAFLFFLKQNILPLLYSLSGKVDISHLNRILSPLAEIEQLFRINFPEGYLNTINSNPPAIYGKDFEKGFADRRQKGYKYYDFIVETESFLEILKALLRTSSGYFLLSWYSGILTGRKDPELASKIAKLISILRDTGGKYIYTWHTRKLIGKAPKDRDAYIELVEANDGADPAYPDFNRLFATPQESYENVYLQELAQKIGIPLSEFKDPTKIIFKDLLNAYTRLHPKSLPIIERFREDVCSGKDSLWAKPDLSEFDSLGNTVHPLFLRSVIRGIGTNFSNNLKAANFTALFSRFPINNPIKFNINTNFNIPYKEISDIDKFKEEEIRSKVNTKLILSVMNPFLEKKPVSIDNLIPFLNKENINLRETLESKTEEKKQLEFQLKAHGEENEANKSDIKTLKDQIKKLEKSIKFIEEKKNHFEDLLNTYPTLNEHEKFLTALQYSGFSAEPGSEANQFCISLCIQRYAEDEIFKNQLAYLQDDIQPDLLQFVQLNYFLNTLEKCRDLIQQDKNLEKILTNKENRLHSLLVPYIITKNKKLTFESIDAAFNKLTAGGKLNSEKSKWQDILENTKKNLNKKFHKFKLFVSKTSLDAYYGDMGGICLSGYPDEIKKDGVFVIRLINENDSIISGMALAILSGGGIQSRGIKNYIAAFALNPLMSLLSGFSYRNQLYFYIQFRKVLEELAKETNFPVALMGIHTYGIISNNSGFSDMILNYEQQKKHPAIEIPDAKGVHVLYDESQFQKALLIIEPDKPHTFTADPAINYYNYV